MRPASPAMSPQKPYRHSVIGRARTPAMRAASGLMPMARMNRPSGVAVSSACSSDDDRHREHRGERQAEQEAVADEVVGRVVDSDDLAAGDELGDAAARHHEDQRGDDGLHAHRHDQRPFQSPHSSATAERGDDGQPQARRVALDARVRRGGGGDRDDRAHRDVEAARRDHQRHAGGDQRQRRRAIQDVDEVAVEVAVAPGEREKAGIHDWH